MFSGIDNLEGVKSRLDNIDETISDFKSIIEGITTKLPPLHPSVSAVSIVEGNEASDLGKVESVTEQSALTITRHFVNEQYYGSSSLVSLLSEIQSLLEDRVKDDEDCSMGDGAVSSDESLGACLAAMGNTAKSLIVDDPLDLSNDGLPLALPPKGLLDAFIEPYFNQVNRMLPVFRKESFCENVRKNYEAGSGKANRAWILCFNNIILQTMNVRALGSSSNLENRGRNVHGDAMEAELLRPFLINSRRGLNKLERFVEPKLINVQALISMCVIAQENFQYRLASLLLHQACFVAKSIGLHQQNAMLTDQTLEEALECKYVFWALYVIDKTVALTMGHSCYLPIFDCDVSMPENDPANPFLKHFVARIELAIIQEDSYQSLYSSQASRRGDSERNSSISRLDNQLALWASKHQALCEEAHEADNGSSDDQSHVNTALSYYFYSTRILVDRPGRDPSYKKQSRDDARNSVQLLQRLSGDSDSIGSAVMLRQTFRDHPLVPFFVLFANLIQDPQSEDSAQELRLMFIATDVLRRIQRSDWPYSYTAQLLLITSSCCQAATTIVRKANPHTTSSIHSRIGTLTSSANSDSASGKDDTDAFARTMWTGLVESPSLASAPDLSTVSESWNLDFTNSIDPAVRAMDQELSSADPGLGMGHIELLQPNMCTAWQTDWAHSTAAAPRRPAGFGAASLGEEHPARLTETWLR
ncbi:MAG: hypothetical protein M1830_001340 [Pleopsidium flavum]|nr:MAG: hypothetical protein M1830_001340 [Pleopsidium flavum]